MSEFALSLSRFLSRPVTLYRFDRQHLSWLYAAGERAVTLGGDSYVAAPGMIRTGIKDGGNEKQSELQIRMPYLLDPGADEYPPTQALGDNWRPYPPGDEVLVTILETQYADPEGELTVVWTGHVMQPEYTDTELTLICSPGRLGARKSGMIPRFSRSCWVPWGSQGRGLCNVIVDDFALSATLTAVDGLAVAADEFASLPTGRLHGGFIRWERADGLLERRDIRAHAGDTITLAYGATDLAADLEVTAYPGCAHNEADCAYFNNSPNYPGIKTMPTVSAFDGNRRR